MPKVQLAVHAPDGKSELATQVSPPPHALAQEAALASGLGYAGVPLPTALAVAASHHGVELLAQNVAVAGLSLSTRAPCWINS